MQLKRCEKLNWFLEALNRTQGAVWLESSQGDKYNLKSDLSKYVALGALLGERGDELMLFCSLKEDEAIFYEAFKEHPEIFKN